MSFYFISSNNLVIVRKIDVDSYKLLKSLGFQVVIVSAGDENE